MPAKGTGKLKNLTCDILYQLHYMEGKSLNAIGKMYGARSCSVSEHIQKIGFIAKDSNLKKSQLKKENLKGLTHDILNQLYCVEGKTIDEISIIYNVEWHHIAEHAKKLGIPLRSKTNLKLQESTYETLYQLHWVEEKSLENISKIYNCSRSTLRVQTRKLGLETRDSSTATTLAMSGDKHPNWKGENRKSPINLAIRESKKYDKWRSKCFARDNRTCTICKIKDPNIEFHIDHIKPFSLILLENNIKTMEDALACEELWNINNGRCLCIDCHKDTPTYGVNNIRKKYDL